MNTKRHLTEFETISNNRFYIYRLAKLAKRNNKLFKNICDYLPFVIYINNIDNLNITYLNNACEYSLGADESDILEQGVSFIKGISDKKVLENALNSIQHYKNKGDTCAIITYLQRMVLEGELDWLITNKTFLFEDTNYFNFSYTTNCLGKPAKILQDILEETFVKRDGWEIFSSLTKREKEILKLLANGYTSKQISEKIYIAKTTADTHRRNIFDKLGVKTYTQLFKFAQALELIWEGE